MEVKPSFFSLSGFLAPGLVTIFVFALVWGTENTQKVSDAFHYFEQHKLEGAAGVVAGTGVIALALAFSFVLGCVLSESFIFIGRRLILRALTKKTRDDYFENKLAKTDLDSLLKNDLNTREAYVYTQTCGLDLHWYAGRVRMIGGSGLGLLLVAIYAQCHCLCSVAFWLFVSSLICIAIALYRAHKFDEYVAATAAVIRLAPPKKSDGA